MLLLGKGHELRLLVIVKDGKHIVGDPRQERSVVPALIGVDVAHVLKAEIVGDLAGRQEGVQAEVAREEGQAVEGDRVELCLV